jgi:hypothetical protein
LLKHGKRSPEFFTEDGMWIFSLAKNNQSFVKTYKIIWQDSGEMM